MRTMLKGAFALALVLGGASVARAESFDKGLPEDIVKTEVIVSGSASSGASSVVAAVTVSADALIYGFDFTDSSAGQAALYDGTSAQAKSGTGVFAEANVAANGLSQVRFPLPRKLTTALVANFTNATGRVVVYYTQ